MTQRGHSIGQAFREFDDENRLDGDAALRRASQEQVNRTANCDRDRDHRLSSTTIRR